MLADGQPSLRLVVQNTMDQRQTPSIYKGFVPEFEGLLQRAGITKGKIVIHYCGQVRGTPHTKGLRLRSPEQFGVILTWHEGDNASCMKLSVRPPLGMDTASFNSRLRYAISNGEASKQVLVHEPPHDESPPLGVEAREPVAGNILPQLLQPPSEEEQGVPISPEENVEAVEKRFIDNPEDMELFIMEVCGHGNSDGIVSTSDCSRILVEQFGCRSPGPVIRGLRTRGYFDTVGGTGSGIEQISRQWWEKYRPNTSVSTVVEVQPEPPAETSPQGERKLLLEGVGEQIFRAYAELEQLVATLPQAQADLNAIETDLTALERQRVDLKRKKAEAKERISVIRNAEKRLLSTKRTLGLA